MYWETDTWYNQKCTVISQDRFQLIKRYIHFNDYDKNKRKYDQNRGRLFKIWPLFQALRQNCLSKEHEEYNSVDDQMIHFKVFYVLLCPTKPINEKWGFQVFPQSETSDMFYDFELEEAPDPAREEPVEEMAIVQPMLLCDLFHAYQNKSLLGFYQEPK